MIFFFGRVAGLGKNQTLKRSDGGKRRMFFFALDKRWWTSNSSHLAIIYHISYIIYL